MAEALYQKIARKKHSHLRYIWGDKETGYVLLSIAKNKEFGRSMIGLESGLQREAEEV